MRTILTRVFILLISLVYLVPGSFAAEISEFKVNVSPDKAKVGESLDLTVEAVDVNGKVVTDYTGTFLIVLEFNSNYASENETAELPLSNNADGSYKFEPSDQWKIVFENGIKFIKEGKHIVNIISETDSVVWLTEVEIGEDGVSANQDIKIITPEDNIEIGRSIINISGETKKNHKVRITINWDTKVETISNNQGIFEKEVSSLNDGVNTIIAEILNSDDEVIGTSKTVSIKVNNNGIQLKSVKVLPDSVPPESQYEIRVIATPWLKEASYIINDTITELRESEPGLYTGKNTSPKQVDTYSIDVILKDELWRKNDTAGIGVAKLIVKEPVLPTANTPEPEVTTPTDDPERAPLKITGLSLVELKTKSILKWDKLENAESYNVYKKIEDYKFELIENVTEPQYEINITGEKERYDYFAVQAVWKDTEGEFYHGDLSEATKIKTGPKMLLIIILSLIVWWALFFFPKRKQA